MEPASEPAPNSALFRLARWATAALCLALAAFHIYTAYAGPFYAISQRAFHVGVAAAILFIALPWRQPRTKLNLALDMLAAIVVLTITAYVIWHQRRILAEIGYADPTAFDSLFGYVMIVLLLEVSRRVIGWEFSALTILVLIYGMVGPWLPGIFEHQGFSLKMLMDTSFLNPMGIYGGLTAVSATTIAVYVLFGAILLGTGGATAFLNLAIILAGRTRGGAAQVAVIASAFMGMVNGSAVANVASVGTMTIPMMKRQGYPSHFSGAVEAAASSGGQIMPPIMGAGAFVMAEILGIPYLQIATVAIIPAILYFSVIAGTIYFEARKHDLQALSQSEIPRYRDFTREIFIFLVPIVVLSFLLVLRYTPRYAGFWAIASAIVAFLAVRLLVDRDGSLAVRSNDAALKLLSALREGAYTAAIIGVLVATSQIIVAVIGLTGIGIKASEVIFAISSGNLTLGLIVAAIICLLLGLGLPTVPSYIITVAVAGPALQKLGMDPLIVHMFAFYFACMSGISPPVAGTSFVAAGIASANVWRTSWEACRLALAGFLAPFIFALQPGLLLFGSALDVMAATLFGALALLALAVAFSGFWIYPLSKLQVALVTIAGVAAFVPDYRIQFPALAVVAATLFWNWKFHLDRLPPARNDTVPVEPNANQ